MKLSLSPAARSLRHAVARLSLAAAVGLASACAAPLGDEAAALDGEHAAEGGDGSTADALTAVSVEDLAPVSPPAARIATSPIVARLGPSIADARRLFVIRSMRLDGAAARLVVDADSLVTSVVREDALARSTREGGAADRMSETPFARSMAEVARAATANRALDRIDDDADTGPATEPFALTIDLCQSRRPWDLRLFEWATGLSERTRGPTPVGLAMTGGWAKAHPGELEQLVRWSDEGKLAITWINHSSTHPLHCRDASCRSAEFLTSSEVDFDAEVLGLESALLGRGLVPSIVFRFPGLAHDTRRLTELTRFSLLPLDANAWIAKGQPIAPRAVVLVHGNGNEPPGIAGFLRAVEEPARAAALAEGRSALVSPLLVAPAPPTR